MGILARIFQNGELYLVMTLQGFILEPGMRRAYVGSEFVFSIYIS